MHVHSIKIIPTARELALDSALETLLMPGESAPGKRCLHPVPCRPKSAFPRYVAAHQREGCLAQVTRPPTRDGVRLNTRWQSERIPPPTIRNEDSHNTMAPLSESSE